MVRRPKKLEASEVQALLATGDLKLDKELSEGRIKTYRCPDGKALVLAPYAGDGLLYESHDELRAQKRRSDERAWLGPMTAAAILELDDTFIPRVPELVEQVPDVLETRDFPCDYSLASVETIDRILRAWEPRLCLDTDDPDVMLPLWAYVGEVIRRQTGGRWKMMRCQPGEPLEPVVADRAGKRGVGVSGLFKELVEYFEDGSLAGLVEDAIRYLGRKPEAGSR